MASMAAEKALASDRFRLFSGQLGDSLIGARLWKALSIFQSSASSKTADSWFAGGGDARDVSEKFGNSIDRSNFLFKTCNPVDLEKVRQTDAVRLEGRRRRNKT